MDLKDTFVEPAVNLSWIASYVGLACAMINYFQTTKFKDYACIRTNKLLLIKCISSKNKVQDNLHHS